jgi:hypothetical protein
MPRRAIVAAGVTIVAVAAVVMSRRAVVEWRQLATRHAHRHVAWQPTLAREASAASPASIAAVIRPDMALFPER